MNDTHFDPADVALLAQLEAATRTYIEACATARPGVARLQVAGYDGAGWLLDYLPTRERPRELNDGEPWCILNCLDMIQKAAGDEITLSWMLETREAV